MNWRVMVSVANLVAIAVAFIVLFEFPQYANDAFYVLIAWMVTGFVLLYAVRPRALATPGSPLSSSSPFPSTAPNPGPAPGEPGPAGGIGFCIYCATPIPPGTRACPACGHALPRW
jgi:hypothetical protein